MRKASLIAAALARFDCVRFNRYDAENAVALAIAYNLPLNLDSKLPMPYQYQPLGQGVIELLGDINEEFNLDITRLPALVEATYGYRFKSATNPYAIFPSDYDSEDDDDPLEPAERQAIFDAVTAILRG